MEVKRDSFSPQILQAALQLWKRYIQHEVQIETLRKTNQKKTQRPQLRCKSNTLNQISSWCLEEQLQTLSMRKIQSNSVRMKQSSAPLPHSDRRRWGGLGEQQEAAACVPVSLGQGGGFNHKSAGCYPLNLSIHVALFMQHTSTKRDHLTVRSNNLWGEEVIWIWFLGVDLALMTSWLPQTCIENWSVLFSAS